MQTRLSKGFVYDDNKSLNYIPFEEGRIKNVSGALSYEYHLKDHLGNTRVAFEAGGSGIDVKQVADYYPFGSSFIPVSPNNDNKYMYNGKEKQDDVLGGKALDWYDYGWREYDPQLGRFTTQDRFAEKYFDLAPYQYAAGNPIKFIDVNGDSLFFGDEFLQNKYTSTAMAAILSTKAGKEYFAKFAAKGQSFKIAGKTFTFGDDGVYSKNKIDLKINNVKSTEGGGAGETTPPVNGEGCRWGTTISIIGDYDYSENQTGERSPLLTAETILHEAMIHAEGNAKDVMDNGMADNSNIDQAIKDNPQVYPSHYQHQQNNYDRMRTGGRTMVWPGTAYSILQQVDKQLNTQRGNNYIMNIMSNFVGFNGKLFY